MSLMKKHWKQKTGFVQPSDQMNFDGITVPKTAMISEDIIVEIITYNKHVHVNLFNKVLVVFTGDNCAHM